MRALRSFLNWQGDFSHGEMHGHGIMTEADGTKKELPQSWHCVCRGSVQIFGSRFGRCEARLASVGIGTAMAATGGLAILVDEKRVNELLQQKSGIKALLRSAFNTILFVCFLLLFTSLALSEPRYKMRAFEGFLRKRFDEASPVRLEEVQSVDSFWRYFNAVWPGIALYLSVELATSCGSSWLTSSPTVSSRSGLCLCYFLDLTFGKGGCPVLSRPRGSALASFCLCFIVVQTFIKGGCRVLSRPCGSALASSLRSTCLSSMSLSKNSKDLASWNSELTLWSDYARHVRLQWERTPNKKLLGPELASKLTAKAWAVTQDLDHAKLGKKNGCKYLLRFLQDRLCRTAVPDAGARPEDLLIRLRRPVGMSMSQWSNEVLEAYRKVQRAMIRARHLQKSKPEPHREPSTTPTSPKSPSRTSPQSPARSMSSPTRRTAGLSGIQESGDESGDYAEVPQEEEPEADGREDWWSPEDWRRWKKEQRRAWDDDSSIGNSLRFSDLELALRDQEEELLAADHGRGHQSTKRRSYWIEENGCWGMIVNPAEEFEENAEQQVHWVGNQLPMNVYDPAASSNNVTEEDDEIYWIWEADGWHGYVPDGYGYWMETDGYGVFWTCEDPVADLTPEETKELDEAYMAYGNKARTSSNADSCNVPKAPAEDSSLSQ
eukprot:s3561_g18.t1